MPNKKLSHLNAAGHIAMVDVSAKEPTARLAVASGTLACRPETARMLAGGAAAGAVKGDAFAAARIAGVMAAKQTAALIPLCHPVPLTDVQVELAVVRGGISIRTTARTVGRTGVEMEALVAASAAALTLYDMGKSMERGMAIKNIQLEKKAGGKSGTWLRQKTPRR